MFKQKLKLGKMELKKKEELELKVDEWKGKVLPRRPKCTEILHSNFYYVIIYVLL
jgi:hypothetical protein